MSNGYLNTDSGRVESPRAATLVTIGSASNFANDSLGQSGRRRKAKAARRPYITRARAEAIGGSLGPRELAILADIDRLGVASGGQLQRLHYPSTEAGRRLARQELSRMSRLQVLDRLGRSVGGKRAGSRGYLYALGTAGQRIAHPNQRRFRAPWTPSEAYASHALAVSDLYLQLRVGAPDGLSIYDTEPRCWRRYFGPGGAPAVLKPDAFAVLEVGDFEDRYFVEIDCGTESSPKITDKAKVYARYWQAGREQGESGVFPWVIWVTTTSRRQALLTEALTRLPADHWQLFIVTTMGNAATLMIEGPPMELDNEKEVNK